MSMSHSSLDGLVLKTERDCGACMRQHVRSDHGVRLWFITTLLTHHQSTLVCGCLLPVVLAARRGQDLQQRSWPVNVADQCDGVINIYTHTHTHIGCGLQPCDPYITMSDVYLLVPCINHHCQRGGGGKGVEWGWVELSVFFVLLLNCEELSGICMKGVSSWLIHLFVHSRCYVNFIHSSLWIRHPAAIFPKLTVKVDSVK